jgi:cob(I)alamin adenosyltransferase
MARLQCGADTANHNMDDQFARIQNDLFDLGADLATVDDMKPALRITAAQVTRLELEIDEINDNLSALNSFILPGGTPLAAWLHLARTVARRAERQMTELATVEPVNEHAMQYINRLSDLLFVLARHANDGGKSDILWVPGGTQEADKG